MSEHKYFPEKIYIEKTSTEFPLTKKILKNTGSIPVEIISDLHDLFEGMKFHKDPVGEGKKNLLICRQEGEFVKPCPCTPHYRGCGYFIINTDLNCPLDCTYCILQLYLSNPFVTVFVNTSDLWKQLDAFCQKNKTRSLRIGTGELGDSLALDHITARSKDLIAYFRKRNTVIFELKTKTTNITNILNTDPAENIVIAWSLNSEEMFLSQEKGAPSPGDRIEAARSTVKRGYKVAFHFDPLIFYPGWKEGYTDVIDKLFSRVPSSRIAWISLGSLRFPPYLKKIIKFRFPETKITYEELIRGKDGKLRYFRPIREQMYREITILIRDRGGKGVPLYFCMENNEIWKRVFKKEPGSNEEVAKYLSLLPGQLSDLK